MKRGRNRREKKLRTKWLWWYDQNPPEVGFMGASWGHPWWPR